MENYREKINEVIEILQAVVTAEEIDIKDVEKADEILGHVKIDLEKEKLAENSAIDVETKLFMKMMMELNGLFLGAVERAADDEEKHTELSGAVKEQMDHLYEEIEEMDVEPGVDEDGEERAFLPEEIKNKLLEVCKAICEKATIAADPEIPFEDRKKAAAEVKESYEKMKEEFLAM